MLVRQWLYDNSNRVLAELDGDGDVVTRFVYGAREHAPEYIVQSDTVYRVVTDHIGSVRLVVNSSSGFVAQSIVYDAWGNELTNSAPDFQPLGFAGGLYDADTQLLRLGARDYHAAIGRWTTPDMPSLLPTVRNRYEYALGDPVSHLDPTGYLTEAEAASIRSGATVLGAGIGYIIGFLTGGGGAAMTGPGAVAAPAAAIALGNVGAAVGSTMGLGIGNAIVIGFGEPQYFCREGDGDDDEDDYGVGDEPIDHMGSNQRANKQVDDIQAELKFNNEFRERLHDRITGRGLNYHQIRTIAKAMLAGDAP